MDYDGALPRHESGRRRHFFEPTWCSPAGRGQRDPLAQFMELLYMGIDASCTHMYERGLAIQMRGARSAALLTGSWTCCGLFGQPGACAR